MAVVNTEAIEPNGPIGEIEVINSKILHSPQWLGYTLRNSCVSNDHGYVALNVVLSNKIVIVKYVCPPNKVWRLIGSYTSLYWRSGISSTSVRNSVFSLVDRSGRNIVFAPFLIIILLIIIVLPLSVFRQKSVRHISQQLLNGNQWNFTVMLSTMRRCADYFLNFQNGCRCHGNGQNAKKK